MYVLDASVVLKWFIEEEDSEKANSLLTAHVKGEIFITIPDLLISEVSNALRYSKDFSQSETLKAIKNLYDLELDIIAQVYDITKATIKLAYKKGITFYDALYISLAQELGFQYITADKKLYRKTKDLSFVTLLNEFEIQ